MPKKTKVAAVAEISGGGIEMKIGQRSKEGIHIIDTLAFPLSIGKDTFTIGRVDFDKADRACEILKNFAKAASEYGADELLCLSGSAIREAENKDYILDQIRVKTGLEVEVLDDRQEKTRIYKHMCALTPKEFTESSLMAHIGSGTLGVCVFEKGHVTLFQNIRVGSLRLNEMFEERQDSARSFRVLVEEYLASFTDALDSVMPARVERFVASGSALEFFAPLGRSTGAAGGLPFLSREAFFGLYDNVKNKPVAQIAELYGINEDEADALPPALSIFKDLLAFTTAEKIYMPPADLSGAALWETLSDGEGPGAIDAAFDESAVISAELIAGRFNCSKDHYGAVVSACLLIFNKLRKIHGLGGRERLLLHIAAILHDIGKYVSLKTHYRHSYNIIRGLEIIGLSTEDMEVIANVALYHSSPSPKVTDTNFSVMRSRHRALTAKLSAIIRLADALDRSHRQKVKSLEAKVTGDRLIITAAASEDMALEEWSFERKGMYFKEVLGLNAELKVRKN